MNSKHCRIVGILCYVFIFVALSACISCAGLHPGRNSEMSENSVRIVFLHHSTGGCIWQGGMSRWFARYNSKNNTNYIIGEQSFPQ